MVRCIPGAMARPLPRSSTRATALASPLSTFVGWHLLAHCAQCGVRHLEVSDLVGQIGGGALVRDVVARLRCRRCNELPQLVELCDGFPARAKGPVQWIRLVGPS